MTSRIEQIIEEIEEYIDSCNYSPLSKKNIVVNKEEIEELLRELRMKTPDEIKRYQKILANKDAILADAQAKAEMIVNQANMQLSEMISEQEIMKQAYAQANAVVEADTMFLATSLEYAYLSSTTVKEVAFFNGDITGFVPSAIVDRIYNRVWEMKNKQKG